MINNKYRLLNKIGEGSFGCIYKAENFRTREEVAIKIESIEHETNLLKNESYIYQYLLGTPGIPQVKWYGKDELNYYMVIPLLGKSLEQLLCEKQIFSMKLVLQIGIKLLQLLKSIHEKGLVHRDIKPDNFLLSRNLKEIFLIDFGLCRAYINNNIHIEMKKNKSLIGSLTYCSINAHENIELSRRDDLESLGYMLIYFSLGGLPWRETKEESKLLKQKMEIILNSKVPTMLKEFINYTRNIEFKETPKYELLINKFKGEIDCL
jgi:casein kinase I family protein HRR25